MAWTGVITNVGAALLDQWALGGEMIITSAATGTGTVATAALVNQTALASQKQTASIISSEKLAAGVKLKLQITSPGTGYTLNQYGVWAKLDSGTPVMLALFQNPTGVVIPSSAEQPDFVYTLFALLKIASGGELTVTVDTSALVTQTTMEAYVATVVADVEALETALETHTGDTSNPHSVTKSQVGLGNVPNVSTNNQTPTYTEASSNASLTSGEQLSVAFGKIAKAISSLISHLADTTSHITAAERTSWNGKTSNLGTITKVQANGTDVASSGTANIPPASTSAYGVTKLSSSTSSTSTSLAATPSAVKAAYDLAAGKAAASHTHGAGDITSGTLPIARGGTGATSASAAITALGGPDITGQGTVIPDNTDLNTIITPGTYKSQSAASSATMPNAPWTNAGFKLFVVQGHWIDSVKQYALADQTLYIRSTTTATQANPTWSAWEHGAKQVHTHDTSDIASGTLPLARGGTGQTTAAAAASALITALGNANGNVQDNTLLATSDATGETNTWYRRPASKIWNYIKSKADEVYAALSHTHAMTDVTGLTAAVTYGPSALASFQGSEDFPLKTCRADIQPVQAGSGNPSPSNIRPISGWTGARVTRCGKNLANKNLVTGNSYTSVTRLPTGIRATVLQSGTYRYVLLPVIDDLTPFIGKSITMSCKTATTKQCLVAVQISKNGVEKLWRTTSQTPSASISFPITSEYAGAELRINLYAVGSMTGDVGDYSDYTDLQVEIGQEGTDYEPFAGEAYDFLFPAGAGTVYGGTLDVLTGTLTADRLYLQLSGNQNWAVSTTENLVYLNLNSYQLSGDTADRNKLICSHFKTDLVHGAVGSETNNAVYLAVTQSGNHNLRVNYRPNDGAIDLNTVKAYLNAQISAGTPVVICAILASPTTYQLTPHQVTALLGQNHVWSDTGDATVAYGEFPGALQRELERHTHAATDITSGVLPVTRGGTGNSAGYVTAGQKSGTTLGTGATAEGHNTTASEDYSHAEGNSTVASGHYSHAEGYASTASGLYSHAEGSSTAASETAAHAEGEGTQANGTRSHAEGQGTIANGSNQHVFGRFNVADTSNVEIVGWGTMATNRKNIRTLATSGNEWIAGTLTQASDSRLKDVRGEVPDLSEIRAVRFRWNDIKGTHDDKDHIGYIAQDVEKIAPFLVGDDSNGYKSLDYIALLVAKVEYLERRVAELEGRG